MDWRRWKQCEGTKMPTVRPWAQYGNLVSCSLDSPDQDGFDAEGHLDCELEATCKILKRQARDTARHETTDGRINQLLRRAHPSADLFAFRNRLIARRVTCTKTK